MEFSRTIERSFSVMVLALLSIQVLIPLSSSSSFDIDNELIEPPSRSPVTLEWKTILIESIRYQISTPSIVDLNNDGKMEVVVHSSNGYVCALNNNGGYDWPNPFKTNGTDIAGEGLFKNLSGSYVPPFFSSPLTCDLNLGDYREIIISEKGGLVSIGWDGEYQWRTNLINATVISTASAGDFSKVDPGGKPEIATIVEYYNGSSFLEVYDGHRDLIASELITNNSYGTSSSVVIDDIDIDGDLDLIVSHPNKGLLLYSLIGAGGNWYLELVNRSDKGFDGYQASTPAVGNVTGGPEKEIVISLNQGWGEPDPSNGSVTYLLDHDLNEIGRYSFPQKIYSSPVIAELDGNESRREIIITTANGSLIVFDSKDELGVLPVKWEYDTEGEVLSSPAVCDINDDQEPEIIISTVDGRIFCFDGDPSDGIDEGIPDVGGFTNMDLLWKYEFEEPTGISSPVISDIDLDGYLELLIGSENGSMYCLGIGPTHHIGKIEWPTFHGNNNRTGTYNMEYYGVDIYARRDLETGETIEKLRKDVQPGSFVRYNLTIENTGKGISSNEKQRFNISVKGENVSDGWSYYLDTPPDRGNDNPDYII